MAGVAAAEGDVALLLDASGRELSRIEAKPPLPLSKAEAVAAALATGDWQSLTVAHLKKELGRRGLKKTGTKAALIRRLRDHESDDE